MDNELALRIAKSRKRRSVKLYRFEYVMPPGADYCLGPWQRLADVAK